MSKYFSHKYDKLKAYVPGEQPRDMQYVKLNTNESPYPPSKSVIDAAKEQAGLLNPGPGSVVMENSLDDPHMLELSRKLLEN